MSLHFGGGTGDRVDFGIGGAASLGNGAFTMIVLWKFAGNTGLLAGMNSGTERQGMLISPALFGSGDFSSGFGSFVNGDWYWIALSKPAGAAHYRGHIKDYTTGGTWSHGEAVGAANHSDPGVSNSIRVAAIPSTAASQGDVAVSAVFTAELSDAAIQAACSAALADLVAASPAWAVKFEQAAPTNIQDLIGSGHETSRTGTITASADPPGYDFSLAAPDTVSLSGAGTVGGLLGTAQLRRIVNLTGSGAVGGLTGAAVVRNPDDIVIPGDLAPSQSRSTLAASQSGARLTAYQDPR